MLKKSESLVEFMLRYSLYAIMPGMWFAYIAGVSPWYGAVSGLTLTLLIALPARMVNQKNET